MPLLPILCRVMIYILMWIILTLMMLLYPGAKVQAMELTSPTVVASPQAINDPIQDDYNLVYQGMTPFNTEPNFLLPKHYSHKALPNEIQSAHDLCALDPINNPRKCALYYHSLAQSLSNYAYGLENSINARKSPWR